MPSGSWDAVKAADADVNPSAGKDIWGENSYRTYVRLNCCFCGGGEDCYDDDSSPIVAIVVILVFVGFAGCMCYCICCIGSNSFFGGSATIDIDDSAIPQAPARLLNTNNR